MGLPLAGLVSSGAGFLSSLTGKSTLMQFQNAQRQTLVEFDMVAQENYTQASSPTAYAVEDASTITDHITRLPTVIDVTGYVTNTPIGGKSGFIKEGIATAASAFLPPLGVVAGGVAASLFTNEGTSRSKTVFRALKKLQLGDKGSDTPPTPFTVVSKLGRWENMMIANLQVPRDLDTGDGLYFQINLVQVIIVAPQSIPLSALDVPSLAGAKRALGDQSTDSDVGGGESIDFSAGEAGRILGYQRVTGG